MHKFIILEVTQLDKVSAPSTLNCLSPIFTEMKPTGMYSRSNNIASDNELSYDYSVV